MHERWGAQRGKVKGLCHSQRVQLLITQRYKNIVSLVKDLEARDVYQPWHSERVFCPSLVNEVPLLRAGSYIQYLNPFFWVERIHQTWACVPKKYLERANA
jgi:hypothetical protein